MSATSMPGADLTDDRGPQVIKAIAACTGFSGLTFAGRVVSRKLLKAEFLVSDYLVALGFLGAWLESGLGVWDVKLGFGKHIEVVSMGNVEKLLKVIYAQDICYIVSLPLIKISILLYYRAIFLGRIFDVYTYAIGAFVIAWGVGVLFAAIFSCYPVSGFWDLTMEPAPVCINYRTFHIANSATNIFADVMILCLPMGKIWNLHMSRKSKAAVSGMFLMGGFVVVASCLRFKSLLSFDETDMTWSYVSTGTWSCVEVNVAVVSACLPTMGPVLQGVFPSSFLVKILGTLGTLRFEGDGALYIFSRSARTQGDEEMPRLHEHNVDRSPAPEFQHMRSAILHE